MHFHRHDTRQDGLDGPFDLIMCRNLVFTYFNEGLQQEVLARLGAGLLPGGVRVLGGHESLPEPAGGFQQWQRQMSVYRWPGAS